MGPAAQAMKDLSHTIVKIIRTKTEKQEFRSLPNSVNTAQVAYTATYSWDSGKASQKETHSVEKHTRNVTDHS